MVYDSLKNNICSFAVCIYNQTVFSLFKKERIMRIRINKGTLVSSTNPHRYILSKRLIVQVTYNFKKGIIKENTIEIRQTINQ